MITRLLRSTPFRTFVLYPLVIVAAVAMLLVTESTMESDRAGRGIESLQAEYAALAAIEHAQWRAEQDDCAAYDLPTTPFGTHSYSATFGPTEGSPVLVSATATLASGIESHLYDPEWEVRLAAIDAISELESESSVYALAGLLSDPDPRIRQRVADALSEIGGESAMLYLEQARHDPSQSIRMDVESILSELAGDRAN